MSDADAGADIDIGVSGLIGGVQDKVNGSGNIVCRHDLVGAVHHHSKLVTAKPREQNGIVIASKRGPGYIEIRCQPREPPGDLYQHIVARLVPHRVVDNLKAVQINEYQRRAAFSPQVIGFKQLLQARFKKRPVRQAGKQILK
jgi:hypothetical protein